MLFFYFCILKKLCQPNLIFLSVEEQIIDAVMGKSYELMGCENGEGWMF